MLKPGGGGVFTVNLVVYGISEDYCTLDKRHFKSKCIDEFNKHKRLQQCTFDVLF